MTRGRFITLEGPEGAGKTTVMRRLAARLRSAGESVVETREPGGVRISEAIRGIILDRTYTEMEARTEALLYAAARRQHLVEVIAPALRSGATVLCDRFLDSSLAYQGFARGIGIEEVRAINSFAIDGALPDVTLLFDLAPEEGLRRIAASEGRETNRLDLETLAFHEKVREGFLRLAREEAQRIRIVDASQSMEAVEKQALALLSGE